MQHSEDMLRHRSTTVVLLRRNLTTAYANNGATVVYKMRVNNEKKHSHGFHGIREETNVSPEQRRDASSNHRLVCCVRKMFEQVAEVFLSSCRYMTTRTTARQPGSGRKSIITEELRRIVDEKTRDDDETTTIQLHQLL